MRHISLLLTLLATSCGGGGATDPGVGVVPDGGTSPDGATSPDGPTAAIDAPTPDAPVHVAVDVKTIAISGVVTANGQIPAQSCTGSELRGQVLLSELSGHAAFRLDIPCADAAQPFAFSGSVYPGIYRVQVSGDRSDLPPMSLTVDDALDLRAARADLAWDIHTHPVGGTITQNGQPPAQNCQPGLNRAQVHFQEKTRGYFFSFPVPCDTAGTPYTFAGTVAPGTYDVTVMGENSSLPQSMHLVQSGLVVDGDRLGLSYDLVTHPVSGVVTLNGAVPGQDATCRTQRGQVIFSSTTGGSFGIRIPCAPAGTPFSFAGDLYPGTYRVEVTGTGSELPRDKFRAPDLLVVGGPLSGLAVDVKTFALTGTVTLNGATPPPCTGATWGELTAEDPQLAYNLSIPVTCAAGGPFAFSAALFPGTYTLYARINDGEILVVAEGLTVDAPRSGLVLDATTVQHTVSGTLTKNGAVPASTCAPPEARATVELVDDTRGSSVTLTVPCDGAAFAFSGPVPPGSYRVIVRGAASDLPTVGYELPAPLVVTGQVAGLALDVPTRPVAGTITVDGAAPACTARTAAKVSLIDAARRLTFSMTATCDDAGPARFAGEVYPGRYDVVVYGAASTIPEAGFLGASGVDIH